MTKLDKAQSFNPQTGGITILVALSLLVLLTIAAVSMSRNSFREVVISGTSRQGAMVRNTADAGIEWSVYWLTLTNAPSASGMGTNLNTLKATLLANNQLAGQPYDVITQNPYTGPPSISGLQADQTFTTVPGTTQGFSVAMTRMGKLPIADISQGITQGTFGPAKGGINLQAPDLWAVRSDAQVQVGTGALAPNFLHSKEAWISTPVQ